MFATRWNSQSNSVWGQLNQFHEEMNRLVNRWGDGRSFMAPVFPALNVWEESDTLIVEAELPGLELQDLEIFVTGQNQLTLKGERKVNSAKESTQHRQERGFGNFVRTLTLPFPVDDAKVEARLEHGVLTIRLPKHEAAKPRRINIKS